MVTPQIRRAAAGLFIAAGVLLLSLTAILSLARRTLLTSESFADHLASSLADPRVANFVADRITNGVLQANPDLTAFRPLILDTARGAVSTTGFQALVRSGARTAHASLFSERDQSVILSVPDAGVFVKSALAKANPTLAEKVPPRVKAIVASMGQTRVSRVVIRLSRITRRSTWLTQALLLSGCLFALVGLGLASSRRLALMRLGFDLMVAGLVLILLMPAGRAIVGTLPHGELAQNAAKGLWDAFAGALRTLGLVLGAIGLVVDAAAHSLLERLDPQGCGRRLLVWLGSPPGGVRARLLRGVILLVAGALAIVRPTEAVETLIVVIGGGLAFVGLREVFEIALGGSPEPTVERGSLSVPGARVRSAVVLVLAAALVACIVLIGRPKAAAVRLETGACNGAPELCGRRVDAVVFPATHNSMSAADIPDWLFPQQEKGIPMQLQDGIRGLLIDVHYGIPVEGAVKTDLASELGSREKYDKAVGKAGVDAAMRVRDRLEGKQEGKRGLYLCHGFCELGATPLVEALRAIHEFLVQNPDEVLVFDIEDYASPQDIAAAFAESGLDELVYRGPTGPPWPTLREMIESRQSALVVLESGRKGISWLHPAYEGLVQETPYHFTKPSELSCVPNRGGTTGSLFLLNNWIDTTPAPKPSNAAIVNEYESLLARARQCSADRGHLPNLIAVDFYRTGALFRVARTMNGLTLGAVQ